jgi:hypothetical protein
MKFLFHAGGCFAHAQQDVNYKKYHPDFNRLPERSEGSPVPKLEKSELHYTKKFFSSTLGDASLTLSRT